MITDNTCNGKCSNCGGCCNPWNPITLPEYFRIKSYIEKNNIRPVGIVEGNNVYMDCCFHDRKNKKCLIYPVRPEVCKNFLCSHGEERIDKDRKYYDKRADLNGVHLDRVYPFDLLFYDDPTTLIYLMKDIINPKCDADVKNFLKKTGHPDLAERIECEWDEDNK